MEMLSEFGLLGLGLSAFLAATILPLSSELVLTSLLIAGENPIAVLIVATTGNVAGSVLNYGVGRWGAETILHKWLHLSDTQTNAAEQKFNRFGKWSLLFAWLPVIGDPLTFVAGLLKINFRWFLLLVTLGKCARYWVVSYAVLETMA